MLCQMWPWCLRINWEHVSTAADTSCIWTSGLGTPETSSPVWAVGGRSRCSGRRLSLWSLALLVSGL